MKVIIRTQVWCIALFILLASFCANARHHDHIRPSRQVNECLSREIDSLMVFDQKYRWMISFGDTAAHIISYYLNAPDSVKFKRMGDVMRHRAGIDARIIDSLWTVQAAIDTADFNKIVGIIKTYGYPRKNGPDYKSAVIIGHAASGLKDDAFFEMLRKEVKARNLKPKEYATLYDKVQIELHRPELYYVIQHFGPKTPKESTATPIDLAKTNEARIKIGLRKYKARN